MNCFPEKQRSRSSVSCASQGLRVFVGHILSINCLPDEIHIRSRRVPETGDAAATPHLRNSYSTWVSASTDPISESLNHHELFS